MSHRRILPPGPSSCRSRWTHPWCAGPPWIPGIPSVPQKMLCCLTPDYRRLWWSPSAQGRCCTYPACGTILWNRKAGTRASVWLSISGQPLTLPILFDQRLAPVVANLDHYFKVRNVEESSGQEGHLLPEIGERKAGTALLCCFDPSQHMQSLTFIISSA
jgi:hypothetical protein